MNKRQIAITETIEFFLRKAGNAVLSLWILVGMIWIFEGASDFVRSFMLTTTLISGIVGIPWVAICLINRKTREKTRQKNYDT